MTNRRLTRRLGPAAGQPAAYRGALKGLVLIEPTALTHNPDDLSDYEKKREARMEANQEVLRELGLA